MKRRTKNGLDGAAALEVSGSELRLATSIPDEEGNFTIQTQTVVWRREAATLHSGNGSEELVEAFRMLIESAGLERSQIHVTLNGDFCVTRVVSGTEERVDSELENLEERSALYLSLGPGRKALGGSIRQIDTRHQHALLSVVNEKTLNVLMEAADRLQISYALVEPSLSALARLIGHAGADAHGPTLLVNISDEGVEVGISHNGQLLLDYRPTGRLAPEEIARTIGRHLGRLQRYCDRYVRFTDGKLDTAYLCGDPEAIDAVAAAFEDQKIVRGKVLLPTALLPSWNFVDEVPPTFGATLGTLLLAMHPEEDYAAPNLLERLDAQHIGPLVPAAIKAFWPLAAAVLLVLGGWYLVAHEAALCQNLRDELFAFQPDQQEAQRISGELQRTEQQLELYRQVRNGLYGPRWRETADAITQCLPDRAWLEEITVNTDGSIELKGNSLTEEGVYRFVAYLRRYPGFAKVILNETEPLQQLGIGGPDADRRASATRFDVRCQLAGRANSKEQGDGDI